MVDDRRRSLLKLIGVTGAAAVSGIPVTGLALDWFKPVENPLTFYPDREWESLYRDQYRHDEVKKTVCTPNCTHSCHLKVFIRNGVAVRLEPDYDFIETSGLSANWLPRGCSDAYKILAKVYGPYRIKYPMIRVGYDPSMPPRQREGQRGDGRFRRATWKECETIIATKLIELKKAKGGDTIWIYGSVPPLGFVTRVGSVIKLNALLQSHMPGFYEWYADLPPANAITIGYGTVENECNDWRNSKYIIMHGANLVETKRPDVHWLLEALERGAKLVVIDPNFTGSAAKADTWISVRHGTDSALVLGFVKVIVDEKLYEIDYVKKWTTLPFLVRSDTKKYLRAEAVIKDYDGNLVVSEEEKFARWGGEEVGKPLFVKHEEFGDYVVWDAKAKKPVPVSFKDIGDRFASMVDLDAVPLDAEIEVPNENGPPIKCKTAFRLQKETLGELTLEDITEITTVPAEAIQQVAREFASTKPACFQVGQGVNHWFHCNTAPRAMFLMAALTGNMGKAGGNVNFWAGQHSVEKLNGVFYGGMVTAYRDLSAEKKEPIFFRPVSFNYPMGKGEDPQVKRGGHDYPGSNLPPGETHFPRQNQIDFLWPVNGNWLNQVKDHDRVRDWYLLGTNPEVEPIDTVVSNDWVMTHTCDYADIVLPVPSWLEQRYGDISVGPMNGLFNYQPGQVIEPVTDAKMDGEVASSIAKAMTELLNGEPLEPFKDPPVAHFAHYFDDNPLGPEKYIEDVLAATKPQGRRPDGTQITLADIKKGPQRMTQKTFPKISLWETFNDKQHPLWTKTGRMEFYKEEDRFIELEENVIRHKEPVEVTPHRIGRPWAEAKKGKNPLWHEKGYTFAFNTPHSRHNTHSSFREIGWTEQMASQFGSWRGTGREYVIEGPETTRIPMLGEAQGEMNPGDAERLDIQDGDYARVSNDRGELVVRVITNGRIRPGGFTIYHGWWVKQLKKGSWQSLTPSHTNPSLESDEIVSRHVFMQDKQVQGYSFLVFAPTAPNRDCAVTIEKVEDGKWWPRGYRKNALMATYDGTGSTGDMDRKD